MDSSNHCSKNGDTLTFQAGQKRQRGLGHLIGTHWLVRPHRVRLVKVKMSHPRTGSTGDHGLTDDNYRRSFYLEFDHIYWSSKSKTSIFWWSDIYSPFVVRYSKVKKCRNTDIYIISSKPMISMCAFFKTLRTCYIIRSWHVSVSDVLSD